MYIVKTGDSFGFTDVPTGGTVFISRAKYEKFFELQSLGKQFILKDINGFSFEDMFEEFIPETIPQEPSEIDLLKEKNQKLELQLTDTQLALVDVYELILGGQ